jgi:hypothetical protein
VDLVSIVAGAIVGTVIGWMGKEFLPPLWRRIQGRPPVIIHVETNPAVFEAGLPPWIGYGFVFADEAQPGRPPIGPCQEWWAWAKERGGVDAGVTKLRLTLIGDELTTVVMDALRVVITKHTDPLNGTYVVCTVGGADITTRHIAVDLDLFGEPTTRYVKDGGESTGRFVFQLTRGEAEIFNIEARAESSYCEWVAELFLLVDGKRRTISIDDDGKPFRTTAPSGLKAHHWTDERWAPLHASDEGTSGSSAVEGDM